MALKLGMRPEPPNARYAALPLLHTLLKAEALPPVPTSMTPSHDITAWGMLGNTLWGDCVAAGVLHTIHAWTHWATGGSGVHGTVEQALAFYRAVTLRHPENYPVPFDPSDPTTDNGLVPSDAFLDWYDFGLEDGQAAKDFILGFATLRTGADAFADTQRAVAWSGGAGTYWTLQNSAMDQFNQGQPWTLIPGDGSGVAGLHFAPTLDYEGQTGQVSTWAKLHAVGAPFFGAYMIGGIVAVSPDAFDAHGLDPDSIDLETLEAAMAQFSGQVGA